MKTYLATLIAPDGTEAGFVYIYAKNEPDARGQLMRMGITDYCELEELS